MAIASTNPATGEVLAEFDELDGAQVDERLGRAAAAFARHRRTPLEERSRKLRRAAEILEGRSDELGRTMTLEMGKPIGSMRRFLKKTQLPAGTRYALLTTEGAPRPDKKTGRIPTEEEIARWEKVRPTMNEILQGKGLVEVAEDKVHVTGMKGPLEVDWQHKVDEYADRLPLTV